MARNMSPAERVALKERLYGVLKSAARQSAHCPSLRDLGELVGRDHKCLTRWLNALEQDGLIVWRERHNGRLPVVYIPEIDAATTPKKPKPKAKKARKGTFRLFINRQLETRPAVDTDAMIYGGILEDVKWLRRRGFAIHREIGGYRVGNALVTAHDIVAKAERERRLAGVSA
jgi:hypothetical protein